MSSRRRTARRAQQRRDPQQGARSKRPGRFPRNLVISLAAGGGILLLVVVIFLRAGTSSLDVTDVTHVNVALAERNAGTAVDVIRGSTHTVLHSMEPFPSTSQPNDDPRPTLVWFSGTWCHFCERMSSFAHTAASDFNDRVRFVEKSVDHDPDAASRYGVRGTPTFVLIDRQGRELTRFHYQADATAFATQIEAVLGALSAHN